MMKKTIDQEKMTKLAGIMLLFTILTTLSLGPAVRIFGTKGVIIPFILWVITMIVALKIEKIKKASNVKTYAEIVAYLDNQDLEAARKQRNLKKIF